MNGVSDQQLIDGLTPLMLDLRDQNREDDEEIVAQVSDVLTGWAE